MDSYWVQFKTPFLCFAGFSGVGKTTLLEKLIQKFSEDATRVGYYKHDAHRFSMDKQGKDTERCFKAGAGIIAINDPRHFAVVAHDHFKQQTITYALEQCDCILIEGYKKSPYDKIVFLDEKGKMPIPVDSKIVKAVIHQGVPCENSALKVPQFHRDAIPEIYSFVRELFRASSAPLYGGVFIGGQSKRMGRPKFSLTYNGTSESERMAGLLEEFCEKTFFSSRADLETESLSHLKNIGRINDEHIGMGPVGGLATLMGSHPDRAWLIVACDMPLLTRENLEAIVRQRDPLRYGTCYVQKGRLGYEPMCAIYEPKFISPLYQAMSRRELSLKRIINGLPFQEVGISPESRSHFMNANTPDEYEFARSRREQENETE